MLRADANAYLVEEYRELATEAEFTSDQTTSAYSVAMDMSLRQLGFAEAALSTADVLQADVLKYLALLNYYALNRFSKLLSIRVDTAAGNNAINTKDSQAFDQVTKLQARAAQEVASYGIDVGGIGAYRMGRINLDFLEPSTTREF
ncbi:MAG TPA: hypothetical protein VHV10_21545 [Ktedonobacteraceae bacterium]|jgi:hypothetical protein|nr:hypothetical protein [Ktedonobacteraceae bacterium]